MCMYRKHQLKRLLGLKQVQTQRTQSSVSLSVSQVCALQPFMHRHHGGSIPAWVGSSMRGDLRRMEESWLQKSSSICSPLKWVGVRVTWLISFLDMPMQVRGRQEGHSEPHLLCRTPSHQLRTKATSVTCLLQCHFKWFQYREKARGIKKCLFLRHRSRISLRESLVG